jgi:hypothetical protein
LHKETEMTEKPEEPETAPRSVLYAGTAPLDVPIDSFLHAMKAILLSEGEEAFLARCKSLTPEQGMLLTSPELVNLIKIFFEDHKLFQFSTLAMEIMTSPPHKRCWPRADI